MILHFYILHINTYTVYKGRRALVFAVLNGKISSRYLFSRRKKFNSV